MSISLNGAIKFLRKKLVVMDLFNLPMNEFKKEIDKIVEENTKTELLHDLVECGLELSKEDKAKWIDPLITDTEEEAAALLDAMEKAAAAQRKEIQIKAKEVKDPEEIRKMFGVGPVECWETSCLYNSACDIYELDKFNLEYPCCCSYKKDCPNRIRNAF